MTFLGISGWGNKEKITPSERRDDNVEKIVVKPALKAALKDYFLDPTVKTPMFINFVSKLNKAGVKKIGPDGKGSWYGYPYDVLADIFAAYYEKKGEELKEQKAVEMAPAAAEAEKAAEIQEEETAPVEDFKGGAEDLNEEIDTSIDENENVEEFPQQEQQPKGFLEKLARKGRTFVLAAMVSLLAGTGGEKPKESSSDTTRNFRQETVDTHFKVQQNIFSTDKETGKKKFNVTKLLFPVQFTWTKDKKATANLNIDVPYEYARKFTADEKAGAAIDGSEHQAMADKFADDMRTKFVDAISGWDKNPETGDEPEKSHNVKITDVSIEPFASPEGPQGKGAKTLKPDAIDEENLELAQARGQASRNEFIQSLQDVGVDIDSVQQHLEDMNINAEELQFSNQEMFDLDMLAMRLGYQGATEEDRIFSMIVDYNDSKFDNNKEVKETLDGIIASKRLVTINANFEGDYQKKFTLPFPILLLLLFALPRLKRLLKRLFKSGKGKPDPEPDKPKIPEKLPPWVPGYITEEVLINDLYPNFSRGERKFMLDGKETAIDYPDMCREIEKRINKGDNKEKIENDFIQYIIKVWRENDAQARREANWQEEHVYIGLDYENQPKQKIYAREHAELLIRIVEVKRALNLPNYQEALEQVIQDTKDFEIKLKREAGATEEYKPYFPKNHPKQKKYSS